MNSKSFGWHGVQMEVPADPPESEFVAYEIIKSSRYVLIGAEGLDRLPPGMTTVPLVAQGFQESAHLMPHLADRELQSRDVWDAVAEALANRAPDLEVPYCALLEASVDVAALCAHLCRQQRISHAGEVAWLRLHDPYVAVHLPRALGAVQLQKVMGCIDRWHLRFGTQWLTLNRPSTSTKDEATPTGASSLDRMASWARLKRIGAVNRALALGQQLDRAGVIGYADHADALVARAIDRHSLQSPQEQARYAHLGLKLDIGFDEHPALVAALGTSDPAEGSWVERLEALPTDLWDRLERESPRPAS